MLLAVAAFGSGERVTAAPRACDFLSKPETWFAGDEARRVAAQYPGGGWPQYDPLVGRYSDHVTFNDDAMVRVMRFVMEVGGDPTYGFVAEPRKQACREAFDRGVACILRCQIVVDGRRTGSSWFGPYARTLLDEDYPAWKRRSPWPPSRRREAGPEPGACP